MTLRVPLRISATVLTLGPIFSLCAQSNASIQGEVTDQNDSGSPSSLVIMIMRRLVFYLFVRIGFSVLMSGLVTTYGQIPVAAINGVVTDPAGAVIVGAE